MAKWEEDVQNYLGFPNGIEGAALLAQGMQQARRFGAVIMQDEIGSLVRDGDTFRLTGLGTMYRARRVLVATGLTHLPPEIPGVKACLGRSLFFCKDCDAYRVQGQLLAVIGWNNEAADYALAMLAFTTHVIVCTNGRVMQWDAAHAEWLAEYHVPIRHDRLNSLVHHEGQLTALTFEQGEAVSVSAAFTIRGDVYHHDLAAGAGAKLDEEGQVIVDHCMRTTVPGLYAAGCVTSANCQMIIAAGHGAVAGQAINRNLFEDSLERHALPHYGDTP
jgi:thioredoxin reductase (NADPH)